MFKAANGPESLLIFGVNDQLQRVDPKSEAAWNHYLRSIRDDDYQENNQLGFAWKKRFYNFRHVQHK